MFDLVLEQYLPSTKADIDFFELRWNLTKQFMPVLFIKDAQAIHLL